MHSDVEQEGLYQNCKFGDPGGRGSDRGVGGKLRTYCLYVKHLKSIFFNAIDINVKVNEYLE